MNFNTDHSACLTEYMCYRNSHSADKGTTFFRHVQTKPINVSYFIYTYMFGMFFVLFH